MKDFKKLSRDEMKKVRGGVNGACNVGQSCTFYDSNFIPHNGTCEITSINGASGCNCVVGIFVVSSAECNI